MKHLSYILFLSLLCILCSCEKKEDIKEMGSLYGTVSDKVTGEPIQNANIILQPTGVSVKTGNDGNFEFTNVEANTYNLYVTKSGYLDYKTTDIHVNASSKDKPVSVLLEKLPPALQVVDDSRHKIDSIVFGEIEGDEMRSFNIFNNSEDALEWEIIYKTDGWIKSFSKESGILEAGKTQAIVVTIDRAKLNSGYNSTVVHIVSDNGSKQLTITAVSINLIETLAATEVTPSSAVLNGKFNKMPTSSIVEYGFVYGAMPTPSLDNGAIKVVAKGTAQVGNFSYAISGLTNEETYFVRAFATTENNDYYGETQRFIAQDVSYVTLLIAGLMVQKTDLGCVDWASAMTMCESSVIGGFMDWRLPTIEELMTLYTEREYIGGFQCEWAQYNDSYTYWASTQLKAGNTYSYYLSFTNGAISYCNSAASYSRSVRAVRTIK